jgi:hypothetical protein
MSSKPINDSLGDLALTILKYPMAYLHIDHDSKSPIDPEVLFKELGLTSCSVESYTQALKQIRNISSRRGAYQGKLDIWKSIEAYVTELAPCFKNNHQIDYHLKGLYGCSLPKNMREMVRGLVNNKATKVIAPRRGEGQTSGQSSDSVSIAFEGLKFTFSKGSSITVGEVKTKTLDFKGLESVHISKIEGGSIHGLTLNA